MNGWMDGVDFFKKDTVLYPYRRRKKKRVKRKRKKPLKHQK